MPIEASRKLAAASIMALAIDVANIVCNSEKQTSILSIILTFLAWY